MAYARLGAGPGIRAETVSSTSAPTASRSQGGDGAPVDMGHVDGLDARGGLGQHRAGHGCSGAARAGGGSGTLNCGAFSSTWRIRRSTEGWTRSSTGPG